MDNSVQNTIKQSIIRRGRGKFVFLQDFSVYGSRDAVKKAFQRLANENFILRIANGIYYYPQIDKVLGLDVINTSRNQRRILHQWNRSQNSHRRW